MTANKLGHWGMVPQHQLSSVGQLAFCLFKGVGQRSGRHELIHHDLHDLAMFVTAVSLCHRYGRSTDTIQSQNRQLVLCVHASTL